MPFSDSIQLLTIFASKYKDIAFRGVIILGGLYLVFWIFNFSWFNRFRVHPPNNSNGQALKAEPIKEVSYVITTYAVYAFFSVMVGVIAKTTGHLMMYTDVTKYGMLYTVMSFFIFLFYTDTTFYWSHVLMHKLKVLKKTHRHHHKFINVTPFAAYAFQLGEAFLSAGSFFVLMLILPWHPTTLLVYVVFSIFYNGMIHSGYDLFPKTWRTNLIMKWWNSPTHHIYHHQISDCNYGFIFTFWDKLMKTEKLPTKQ